jgi:hypothetical protein
MDHTTVVRVPRDVWGVEGAWHRVEGRHQLYRPTCQKHTIQHTAHTHCARHHDLVADKPLLPSCDMSLSLPPKHAFAAAAHKAKSAAPSKCRRHLRVVLNLLSIKDGGARRVALCGTCAYTNPSCCCWLVVSCMEHASQTNCKMQRRLFNCTLHEAQLQVHECALCARELVCVAANMCIVMCVTVCYGF